MSLGENCVHPLYGVTSICPLRAQNPPFPCQLHHNCTRKQPQNQLVWRLDFYKYHSIPLLHSYRNIAVFVYCMQLALIQKEGLFIVSTGENIDLPFIYILIYYSGNILSKTRLPGNEYFHIKNFASQVIGFHNKHH